MKKILISVFGLLIVLFLAGCLDYKGYDLKPTGSIVDDIAALEKEVANASTEAVNQTTETPTPAVEKEVKEAKEVKGEVVLPELGEQPKEEAVDNLQVIKVKENQFVTLKAAAADPNKDQVTVTYSPPLSKKGEWQTNYSDAGEYIITITATDKKLTTEKKVKLIVERVNVAPVVKGIRNITVDESETVNFQPVIADPNKDPVTVTTSAPLQNNTWKTDFASAGIYPITVVASDGELETKASFTLTVNDINVKPKISGLNSDIRVKEGQVVKIEPVVVDPDVGQKVKVTISDPVGDDGLWETGYTDHGTYQITVTAYDGKDTVSQKINLVVEPVNVAPVIQDIEVTTK